MEEQVVAGVRWTFLTYLTSRVVGLVSTFVLARLLVPADFGVVALAGVVVELAGYFTGLGLGPAFVIRQDLVKDDLRTAYSVLLLSNVGTAVAVACLAPLAKGFLHDSRTVPVVLALAAPLLIGGVGNFYASLLQRELQFRPLFVAQATQLSISVVVSVGLAAAGAGVWSLVVGRALADVAMAVVLAALAPYRVRPGWQPKVARSLARSGRGFVLQSVSSFIEQNSDYAVVARTLGADALGTYSMGFRIAEIPYRAIVDPVAQATFPGFARASDRGDDVSRPFLELLRLNALVVMPIGMVLAGASDPVVRTLLGAKWLGVVDVLPLLGFWGAIRALTGTVGWFVSSIGLAARIGALNACLVVLSLPVLILAVRAFGIRGAGAVMLGNVVASVGIGLSITTRRVGISWRRQWEAVRPPVVAAVPTGLVAWGAPALLRGSPAGLQLVAAATAATAVYVLALAGQDRSLLPQAATQLRRVARGRAQLPATSGVPVVGAPVGEQPG